MLKALAAAACLAGNGAAATDIAVVWLHEDRQQPPTLSNLDPPPDDLGVAGARLAIEENRSSGRFLDQTWQLEEVTIADGAAPDLPDGTAFVVIDATPATVAALADTRPDALILNAGAPDEALRQSDCRANLLHTLPTDAMRADALSQFLVSRKWTDVALIAGTHPGDVAFADALKASATKFRLRLRGEKTWAFDADMRRNASQEVPLFTQDLGDHDLLLVADELGDFARYIPYNTWAPRPVGGSEGIVPEAWSPVVEAWGAAQLQSRFRDMAGRGMRPEDFAAWAAVRTLGEAVTRTGAADPEAVLSYVLSDDFELGGFLGRPLSFRPWNGQMRQPIPLVTERAVVATAPIEGFLHQVNELDTLGRDRPESACTAFERGPG